jgi:hypothetical protein
VRGELRGSAWEAKLRQRLRTQATHRDPGPGPDREPIYGRMVDELEAQLPEAELIERAQVGTIFGLVCATLWCRQDAQAHAGSPVPWDTAERQPWVVELHGLWPDRDGGPRRRLVVFTMPCAVDPREPSAEANAAIRAVLARAALHEAQEALVLDGERLDPHAVGELGLAEVMDVYSFEVEAEGGDGDG